MEVINTLPQDAVDTSPGSTKSSIRRLLSRRKASEPQMKTEEGTIQQPPLQDDQKPQFWTALSFDSGSFTPLVPLHTTMPYHLPFYHLQCARRWLSPKPNNTEPAFVPELSCRGTSSFSENNLEKRLPYNWSSEVYFEKGEFLQKQELECTVDIHHKRWPDISANVCRHVSMRFEHIKIGKDAGGLVVASMDVTFQPQHEAYFPNPFPWSSKYGVNLADLFICGRCYSDLEYNAELVEDQLQIRFTCYRVLGAASERFLPTWTALLKPIAYKELVLRGTGYSNVGGWKDDSPGCYLVHGRVWKAAKRLNRPGLHLVTYADRNGREFSGATTW